MDTKEKLGALAALAPLLLVLFLPDTQRSLATMAAIAAILNSAFWLRRAVRRRRQSLAIYELCTRMIKHLDEVRGCIDQYRLDNTSGTANPANEARISVLAAELLKLEAEHATLDPNHHMPTGRLAVLMRMVELGPNKTSNTVN